MYDNDITLQDVMEAVDEYLEEKADADSLRSFLDKVDKVSLVTNGLYAAGGALATRRGMRTIRMKHRELKANKAKLVALKRECENEKNKKNPNRDKIDKIKNDIDHLKNEIDDNMVAIAKAAGHTGIGALITASSVKNINKSRTFNNAKDKMKEHAENLKWKARKAEDSTSDVLHGDVVDDKGDPVKESVDDLRLRVYEAAEAGFIDDDEKYTMLEYLNMDNYE